jgi:hypothetical protein
MQISKNGVAYLSTQKKYSFDIQFQCYKTFFLTLNDNTEKYARNFVIG